MSMTNRQKNAVKKIIVHCFDAKFGTEKLCNKWHTDKPPQGNGWDDTGYHFVILNGQIESKVFIEVLDGQITPARPLQFVGSHCRGQNTDSVGIALVGKDKFTMNQFDALLKLCDWLDVYYGKPLDIFSHHDFDKGKTCPNFDATKKVADMRSFRNMEPVKTDSIQSIVKRLRALENIVSK